MNLLQTDIKGKEHSASTLIRGVPMKKALLPTIIVFTVLLLGGSLAYLLYELFPHKPAQEVITEIVTKEVTKEVPVAVPTQKSNLKDIIKKTQSKVVQIETPYGTGSGFIYNNQGDVVTNAHVVGYETEVIVKTSNEEVYTGHVIGRSDHIDIALVRVAALSHIEPLSLKRGAAELGDNVVALGSPLGLQNTVTVGIISGLNRSFTLDSFSYDKMYQITAPISPGNSGGPIVSGEDGSVLGINSVKHITEHMGFSIPIYKVVSIL
jgi:serine protease Do